MKGKIAYILIIALLVCIGNAKVASAEKEIQSAFKDISGVKRKLTMDSVKRVGVYFNDFNYPSEYIQVADGHYYYMRLIKSNWYTIYRDAGEKVGSFKLADREPGYMCIGFMRYGSKFYLGFRNEEDQMIKIAVVDFEQETTKTICTLHPTWGEQFYPHIDVFLYENKIYCYNYYRKRKVEQFDMSGNLLSTISFPKLAKNESMNFINIADGKIYYAIEHWNGEQQVTFRCRDLKTNKDQKVNRCKLPFVYDYHDLTIPGKEIYYYGQHYLGESCSSELVNSIPSAGGIMRIDKGLIRDFTYNSHCYFYIDGKYRLRRENRKTHIDKVISDIKVVKVNCTKKGLFVQGYDKWFDDEDGFEWANADFARAIYLMNFKGEIVKKVAKGKRGYLDDYDDYM